jgi:hypothetical protein
MSELTTIRARRQSRKLPRLRAPKLRQLLCLGLFHHAPNQFVAGTMGVGYSLGRKFALSVSICSEPNAVIDRSLPKIDLINIRRRPVRFPQKSLTVKHPSPRSSTAVEATAGVLLRRVRGS